MNDRIERYLSDLDRLLAKRIDDKKRIAYVDEIRSHLALSVKDAVASGATDDEAAIEALRNLGSAGVVASEFVRQARGYHRASSWKLAGGVLAFMFILDLLAFFLPVILPNPTLAWTIIQDYSWIGVFLWFGCVVWVSRRWLVTPIIVFSLAITIIPSLLIFSRVAVAAAPGYYVYVPAGNMKRLTDGAPQAIAHTSSVLERSKRILATVESGGHAPADPRGSLVPTSTIVHETAWVPGTVIPVSVTRPRITYVAELPGITQDQADEMWRADGREAIRGTERVLAYYRRIAAGNLGGGVSDYSYLFNAFALAGLTIAVNACFLLALNGAILAIARRRDVRLSAQEI